MIGLHLLLIFVCLILLNLGEDSRSTWEHISQYLAQLGEGSLVDAIKVRLFSLPLTIIAFSWFASLTLGSISSWYDLEKKFHEHFFYVTNELKLSLLTSVLTTLKHLEKLKLMLQCFYC